MSPDPVRGRHNNYKLYLNNFDLLTGQRFCPLTLQLLKGNENRSHINQGSQPVKNMQKMACKDPQLDIIINVDSLEVYLLYQPSR